MLRSKNNVKLFSFNEKFTIEKYNFSYIDSKIMV